MSASNSVARWRRIMFLEGGIPSAVAIVSPEKDGSSTTSPPWTPLSVLGKGRNKYLFQFSVILSIKVQFTF